MVDNDFLQIFLDEADEILSRWETSCMNLEKSPSKSEMDALFRSAHNLKGSARSVGLNEFGQFVHKVEDVITLMKNGQLEVSQALMGLFLDSQNVLVQWIAALRSDPSTVLDTTAVTNALKSYTETPSATESCSIAVSPADLAAGFGFFGDEPAQDQTPANRTEQKPKDLGTILVEKGHATQTTIETGVAKQNRKLGEILIEEGLVSKEAVQQALQQQKASGHKADDTIRVSLRKLDSVLRLIGELSIQSAIIQNASDKGTISSEKALEAISLSSKVIQDLQNEGMSLRMQPLENLFQRLERVARDVARQQGKSINVILKGTDVELDKTVIEKMKDPLVHILRNAVDHGIEAKDVRLTSNKPEMATIVIEGIQTASHVSIRISDDGKGLDGQKILRKAVEKGLIDASEQLSQTEINNLIFLPGFSTADKVTDVSGRGVGMDVVKKAVEELQGKVDISTNLGRGTLFQISLPSTLSILDAIVVRCGQKLYAVPVQDVKEVVDISSMSVTKTQQGRLFNLRGSVIPVEPLSRYISHLGGEDAAQTHAVALISEHQSVMLALEVEKIEGQQSIVVRQLEGKLAAVPGFSGGTILANGEPSMILNLPLILKMFDRKVHEQKEAA